MAVLNVDDVFRFVQFVANKESRGWVSPSEFNIAAELSQIAVYSKLESMFLSNKKIHNDMRPFLRSGPASHGGSSYAFPTDMRQFFGAFDDAGIEIAEWTQAEYLSNRNSTIVSPSVDYPKCVIRDDGIYVYPSSIITDIVVEYIARISTTPTWAYTIVNGRPVYDAGGSVQFEFEDNLFLEIAMLVISNVGMNIKAESVTQYGMAFNKAA